MQLLAHLGGDDVSKLPIRFAEIRIWKITMVDGAEHVTAPVSATDLQPGTALLMDQDLELLPSTKLVRVQSNVYVSDAREFVTQGSEVTEFEILPEDLVDDEVTPELRSHVDELKGTVKSFATIAPRLLGMYAKGANSVAPKTN